MRIRILSVLAAVALVGACETASEESGKASGSGSTALKLAYTAKAPAKASTAIKAGTQQDLVVQSSPRRSGHGSPAWRARRRTQSRGSGAMR